MKSYFNLFPVDIKLSQYYLLKLFSVDSLSTLVENQQNQDVWVYFWTLSSIPLIYVYPIPLPCGFDYFSFIVSFKIRKCTSSNSFLINLFWLFGFFSDLFCSVCNSTYIWGSACPFLQKGGWNFDINCAWIYRLIWWALSLWQY